MSAPHTAVVPAAIACAAILFASCGSTSPQPATATAARAPDARALPDAPELWTDGTFHFERTTEDGQLVLRVSRAGTSRPAALLGDAELVCEARAPRGSGSASSAHASSPTATKQ